MYNTSYTTSPDPAFSGPDWDFYLTGQLGGSPIPHENLGWDFFAAWFLGGQCLSGWYNQTYEVAFAKIYGSNPWWRTSIHLPGTYSTPKISNEDIQYMEGCEEAG